MQKLLFLLALVPLLLSAQQNYPDLLPVKKNGKFGYINRKGEIVIKPQFDRANRFSEGLGLVNIGMNANGFGELYGYIDSTGNFAIPLRFSNAWDFHNGLASIYVNGIGRTYIRKNGERATTTCTYKCFHALEFPLAYQELVEDAHLSQGKVTYKISPKGGYVDSNFRYVIPPTFDDVEYFSEGKAVVMLDGKRGYIDTSGKVIIAPQFSSADAFHNNRAIVRVRVLVNDKPADNYGYIDPTGKVVIPATYKNSSAREFSEGLAAVNPHGTSMSLVNTDKESLWGFIDTNGVMVIPPRYEAVNKFHDGLAPVKLKGKWGFIDKTGKMVIKPQFVRVSIFTNGVATIFTENQGDGRIGYIDTQGKWIWKPTE